MSLHTDLQSILPAEQIHARLIDRHRFARDASFYRLIPQVVVRPDREEQVSALFRFAREKKIPMVFRAAGTSLSGQAITDGILVEINRGWQDYSIDEEEHTIKVQPGIVGSRVNQLLEPYRRKIGPDPASIKSCFIGGIVANNASGMGCGVENNAYHTLRGMRTVLPNGYILDTHDADADAKFKQEQPKLHSGLIALRDRVRADEHLAGRIREKYTRKNTLGYSLNAFIDFDEPAQILGHLMVGSEGTLGFISEFTLETVPDKPYKATALLFFEDIRTATETVVPLKDMDADALELMDRAALRSISDEPLMADVLNALPETAAGLLCEVHAESEEALEARVQEAEKALKDARMVHPAAFTRDPELQDLYWQLRKGLLPAVGAARESGTTMIIEDLCFRLEHLADATLDLQALFKKHGYDDAVIFGHSGNGNIHFVISQAFNNDEGMEQYKTFIEDVVEMAVGKYDGALKGEHGTGRNMAPFLENEWGAEAKAIMGELKALLDPDLLLNPGVIVNPDPEIHLKNIKPTPTIVEVADRCIECGFCEVWCPSRDLTMTPRQRIATWREIQLLEQGDTTDRETARSLKRAYAYEAVDTCAVDGLCALGCPVKIDTGDLTRHFRQERHSLMGLRIADWTVRRFNWVAGGIRVGLGVATPLVRLLGSGWISKVSRGLYELSGKRIPVWNPNMPAGGHGIPHAPAIPGDTQDRVVYFISCLNRGMGDIPGESASQSTAEALVDILAKAKVQAVYPPGLEGLCCGTPYSSKGFDKAYRTMAAKSVQALWQASEGGKLPVLVDTSPCTYKMKHYDDILEGDDLEHWRQLEILDVIEYLHDRILPRLDLVKVPGEAVLHPTCSTRKMGLEDKMLAIARACAEEADYPEVVGCCGFAGDRGFLHPELTESATSPEALSVADHAAGAGHYSTSRTCEVGMSTATGTPYSSIVHLVWKALNR